MLQADNYRSLIENFIRGEAKPVEKYSHQPRLYALTILIGEGQTYDDEIVFAAAWLHDLGVFVGHRPSDQAELERWDSMAYACLKAPRVLLDAGFPPEKIPAVVEAIRTHQPAANPTTIEGVILRDADILEQLGAVGILRAVCKVGRDTRFPSFREAVDVLERSLKELPAQIRLDRTRELSKGRIVVLRDFLQSVRDESGGVLA